VFIYYQLAVNHLQCSGIASIDDQFTFSFDKYLQVLFGFHNKKVIIFVQFFRPITAGNVERVCVFGDRTGNGSSHMQTLST